MGAMIFRRVVGAEMVPAGEKAYGSTATWTRWAEEMECGHVKLSPAQTENGRRRCNECEYEREADGESVYDERVRDGA